MSDSVIRVENLGKKYRLRHQLQGHRYKALRDVLTDLPKRLFSRLRTGSPHSPPDSEPATEDFWALQDVSFEVKQGEAVAIIGRNGAGKSTLLKLLSRITAPTRGRIELEGRVASLLEVGTGFHPELTGRENIYLNGAILGMMRTEIKRKFDEIVAFAEVEKFLDTPVKRYSSGMYMRLAFAVAAHLDPEILIIDEVLAVGDASFQKKCLGKIGKVVQGGRTVLFVSHNMAAVANLCSRALLLVQGRTDMDGPVGAVLERYIQAGRELHGELTWNNPNEAPGNSKVRLHAVRVCSEGGATSDVSIDKECRIVIDYWNLSPELPLSVSIHILDKMGVLAFITANVHSANLIRDDWFGKPYPIGLFRSVCIIPGNFLNEDKYSVRVAIGSNVNNIEIFTDEIISFHVHDTGEMRKENSSGNWPGIVRPKMAWQTELISRQIEISPI